MKKALTIVALATGVASVLSFIGLGYLWIKDFEHFGDSIKKCLGRNK